MIPGYVFKHFGGGGEFETTLDAETIKLIGQILPKEVWDYLLHGINLPNGSAGKMLRNIDTDTAGDQHEAGRVF